MTQVNSDLKDQIATINSNLSKLASGTTVINPNGKNYVDIPINGISIVYAPIAFNGDYDAFNGHVIGCTCQKNILRVHLSSTHSANLRINYWYWVK